MTFSFKSLSILGALAIVCIAPSPTWATGKDPLLKPYSVGTLGWTVMAPVKPIYDTFEKDGFKYGMWMIKSHGVEVAFVSKTVPQNPTQNDILKYWQVNKNGAAKTFPGIQHSSERKVKVGSWVGVASKTSYNYEGLNIHGYEALYVKDREFFTVWMTCLSTDQAATRLISRMAQSMKPK